MVATWQSQRIKPTWNIHFMHILDIYRCMIDVYNKYLLFCTSDDTTNDTLSKTKMHLCINPGIFVFDAGPSTTAMTNKTNGFHMQAWSQWKSKLRAKQRAIWIEKRIWYVLKCLIMIRHRISAHKSIGAQRFSSVWAFITSSKVIILLKNTWQQQWQYPFYIFVRDIANTTHGSIYKI